MILGAGSSVTGFGTLKLKCENYVEDWLLVIGLMNGFMPYNLWLSLMPHNGRNVTLTWQYGEELENTLSVSGMFDFTQHRYRMMPEIRSRKINKGWHNMKVNFTSVLTDDVDGNTITIYGYADVNPETNAVIVTGLDGSTIDMLQTLTDNGFLDKKVDAYIVSETVAYSAKKIYLRSREGQAFIDPNKKEVPWTMLANYYTARLSPMGDKIPTAFTFRIRPQQ